MPTVREKLFRAWATLGMAVYAMRNGEERYTRLAYAIRQKTYKGLMDGSSKIASILREERLKLTMEKSCAYCGAVEELTIDHLMPTKRGGGDTGDNLVYACHKCNSEKGATDLLTWSEEKGRFPAIFVLQRYLKLAIKYCEEKGLMDVETENIGENDLPFDLRAIPENFPQPGELTFFMPPSEKC